MTWKGMFRKKEVPAGSSSAQGGQLFRKKDAAPGSSLAQGDIRGGRRNDPTPTLDTALNNYDVQISSFDKRLEKCEADVRNYIIERNRHPKGSALYLSFDRRAKESLREKKRISQKIQRADQVKVNLTSVQTAKESLANTRETASVLKGGIADLRRMQIGMNVEEIQDIHDNLQDTIADAHDVEEVLAQRVDLNEIPDEDLEAELDTIDVSTRVNPTLVLSSPATTGTLSTNPSKTSDCQPYQPPNPPRQNPALL